MPDPQLVVFLLTSLAIIATPGQDMLLVMSRSIAHGPRAGVATAAGVSAGLLGHTLLAGLGLGAVLRTSEAMFVALKLAGAAYLVYLGARLVLTRRAALALGGAGAASGRGLFVQGAVSNLSNPKIALFYFAFLPQFVPRGAEHPTAALLALGAAFALLTFVVKGPVGFFAGRLSAWLRARPQALVWLHRGSGMVLIGLGLRLALERRA